MIKIIILLAILSVTHPCLATPSDATTCEIYYLPIEAEFYIPPTREYIIQYGTHLITASTNIAKLFDKVSKQKGIELQSDDFKRLRILIICNVDHKELFITADKTVLFRNKKITVDVKYIDKVINEIKGSLKKGEKVEGSKKEGKGVNPLNPEGKEEKEEGSDLRN